ncbi:MAG: Mannitol dehydrogenase domain protein [Marmoricola sp.]|nr:Mannitol dehydrogenase domain protein [Marmoricola sp.]
MLQLDQSALLRLSGRLDVPRYDRSALTPSVVHVGVGGFHRAHQAVYLDELARAGHTGWGVVGVSLRTPHLHTALTPQDGLFSVVELGPGGARARVVGSMTDYLFGPGAPEAVLDRLAHPDTRIVSLTVTGDGYAAASGPRTPADPSWAAYVVAALARRRAAGLGGFTVLSCDNIAASGDAARSALRAYAAAHDAGLWPWIEQHVTFPDAMVDRITPGTTPELEQLLAHEFGLRDRAPVATEPFRQWVVQDDFACGRPPLEDVGVHLVDDVAPYKLVKTRLLNGTHTAIAYLGWLAGHRTAADVVADPLMRAFTRQLMLDEVGPLLPRVPGMAVEGYVETVLDRLGNRSVGDPLERLCRRGSTKVADYLLPSLAEASRRRFPTPLLSLALAGWFRYLRGTDLQGRPIEVQDARLDELQPLARADGQDPARLLRLCDPGGPAGPVAGNTRVRQQVASALRDLDRGTSFAIGSRLHHHPGTPATASRLHPGTTATPAVTIPRQRTAGPRR